MENLIRDLTGLLEKLDTKRPVFSRDIRKDEIMTNDSFFIYDADGEISRGENNQYQIRFYLHYITKSNEDIDALEIIDICKKHALIFSHTELDMGKIQDLDQEVRMTTFVFNHLHKVCYG